MILVTIFTRQRLQLVKPSTSFPGIPSIKSPQKPPYRLAHERCARHVLIIPHNSLMMPVLTRIYEWTSFWPCSCIRGSTFLYHRRRLMNRCIFASPRRCGVNFVARRIVWETLMCCVKTFILHMLRPMLDWFARPILISKHRRAFSLIHILPIHFSNWTFLRRGWTTLELRFRSWPWQTPFRRKICPNPHTAGMDRSWWASPGLWPW